MTSHAVRPSAATTARAPIIGQALPADVLSAAGSAARVLGAAGDDVRVTEGAAGEAAVDGACRGAVEDAWRRSGVAVDRTAFERVAVGLRAGVPVATGAVGAAVRAALRGRWTGAAAVLRGDGRAPLVGAGAVVGRAAAVELAACVGVGVGCVVACGSR